MIFRNYSKKTRENKLRDMRKILPALLVLIVFMVLVGCGNDSPSVAFVGDGILSRSYDNEITIEKIELAYKDAGYELVFKQDELIRMTGAVEKYSTNEMGFSYFCRFESKDILNKTLLDSISQNIFVVNGYWVLVNPDSPEMAVVFENIR